jgi:hypothetical protein
MILAVGGRITNENAEEIGSTLQDLSNLCAALCVAQKMGEDLGYRAILLSKMPYDAKDGRRGHGR